MLKKYYIFNIFLKKQIEISTFVQFEKDRVDRGNAKNILNMLNYVERKINKRAKLEGSFLL